jgi:hypothetical protein
MSVKFKVASKASPQSVERLLGTLTDQGLAAERMFPNQRRPALERVFIIRSPQAKVGAVTKALEPYAQDIEFVEGNVTRRPLSR